MILKEVISFFFEMGQLSRVKREGWRLLGIESPESIADHTLRAAQIGWILAKMEGYENPHEVAAIVIFHDIGEARVGDIHKLANRYITVDEAAAVQEQTSRLGEIGGEVLKLWDSIESRSNQAGILAKDADLLELAVRAREYIQQGFSDAQEWFDAARTRVQSNTAKQLIAELASVSPTAWWHGLKKID
jgi:putative hydrolase of HD superfamily